MNQPLHQELVDYFAVSANRILLVGVTKELLRSAAKQQQRPLRFIAAKDFLPTREVNQRKLTQYAGLHQALGLPDKTITLVVEDIHLFSNEQKMMLKQILDELPATDSAGDSKLIWGLIPVGAFVGEELGFLRVVEP